MPDLVINYGKDIINTTIEALKNSGVDKAIKRETKVSIKPNLVLASPADTGATTHTEVVEGIILYLKELRVAEIKIIEGSWVGDRTDRAYKVCGYYDLAKKYSLDIVDLKKDRTKVFNVQSMDIAVCREALDTDFLINVPVLKAHCQTDLTCCLKNLKGCIPDTEKRHFHSMGLHKPIAALNTIIKTGLCVVDGICGDLTFEEGGNPVEKNMILVGKDPVLIDSYCAKLIGYQPEEIAYIKYAEALGVGRIIDDSAEIRELNVDKKPKTRTARSNIARSLGKYINEKDSCSACYSSLIHALHKLGDGDKRKLHDRINIGQGFRGQTLEGIGSGNCTKGCSCYVKGCPPTAADIVKFIEEL